MGSPGEPILGSRFDPFGLPFWIPLGLHFDPFGLPFWVPWGLHFGTPKLLLVAWCWLPASGCLLLAALRWLAAASC